jgi:hypothetical protein
LILLQSPSQAAVLELLGNIKTGKSEVFCEMLDEEDRMEIAANPDNFFLPAKYSLVDVWGGKK